MASHGNGRKQKKLVCHFAVELNLHGIGLRQGLFHADSGLRQTEETLKRCAVFLAAAESVAAAAGEAAVPRSFLKVSAVSVRIIIELRDGCSP